MVKLDKTFKKYMCINEKMHRNIVKKCTKIEKKSGKNDIKILYNSSFNRKNYQRNYTSIPMNVL